MRHVQLVVVTAAIGTRPLPLRHGTLQIVERTGGAADGSLDWELVLHTIDVEPVDNAVHELHMEVVTGAAASGALTTAELQGAALHVRSVDRGLVFRGDGPLRGFDRALLASNG